MAKIRDSGMPDESMWSGFFSPEETLGKLGLTSGCGDVVDFGCGYGTFSIPAARTIDGTVHALDIEPSMIAATSARALQDGLENVEARKRDFVAEGSGLPPASAGYVMLFNILHAESPLGLLREAFRIMRPGGKVGIMHWRYDSSTPRGPSMDIRPSPEQCRKWVEAANFNIVSDYIELPPYHYGIIAKKGK
jgi:SAM-dependent methyltransferase